VWVDANDGVGGGLYTFGPYGSSQDGALIALPSFAAGASFSGAAVQRASAEATARIIDDGDLDIETQFMPAWADLDTTGPSYTVWSGQTPEGILRLRYEWSAQAVILTVRGVDVLSLSGLGGGGMTQSWARNDDVRIRAWYRPSTGEAGLRMACNGALGYTAFAPTTGGPLLAPTAFWWGSFEGTSDHLYARHTLHGVHAKAERPAPEEVEGVDIGDSISASYDSSFSVASRYYTIDERRTRRWGVLAVPGDYIHWQGRHFLESPFRGMPSVRAFVIQVGPNDIVDGYSLETMTSGLQAIVDSIHESNPMAKVVVCTMSPMRKRLEDVFGANAGPKIAMFDTFQKNILGTGPTPIRSIDAIVSGHTALLGDAEGRLLLRYDAWPHGGPNGTPEGLHPNADGRRLIAERRRIEALVPLGILP
jgi:hypothetical protein